MDKITVFETKPHCLHKHKLMKRVNDIQIGDKVYRQVNCEKCGEYKYEININDYHPLLLKEVIVIK